MHVLSLHITVEGMFLLPNSEHVPIKLKLLLIRAETLDKPLTAKCFIHVVSRSVLFFQSFFFQFATSFLSAVRWGRQALWLVLVVRWLFRATSQCA
jgi:hypothetical protein